MSVINFTGNLEDGFDTPEFGGTLLDSRGSGWVFLTSLLTTIF
jgi:hypothetical protein